MTTPLGDNDDRSFNEKYERIEIAPGRVVYRYVPKPIPGLVVPDVEMTIEIDGEE